MVRRTNKRSKRKINKRSKRKINKRRTTKKGGLNTSSGSWSSTRRRRNRGEEDLQSLSSDNFFTKKVKRTKRKKRKKREDKVARLRREMMERIEQNSSDLKRLESAQRTILEQKALNEKCSDRSSDQFHSASSGSMGYYSDPYVVQQPQYNYDDMRPQFMKDQVLLKNYRKLEPYLNPPEGTNVLMNILRGN